MKVNIGQIQRGAAAYIDTEIISKLNDWRRWVIGAGSSLYLAKASDIFNALKANPAIMQLGIIDENDMVDIDLLYQEIKKQAARGPITFEFPMIGAMTMNDTDVDKIYTAITSA